MLHYQLAPADAGHLREGNVISINVFHHGSAMDTSHIGDAAQRETQAGQYHALEHLAVEGEVSYQQAVQAHHAGSHIVVRNRGHTADGEDAERIAEYQQQQYADGVCRGTHTQVRDKPDQVIQPRVFEYGGYRAYRHAHNENEDRTVEYQLQTLGQVLLDVLGDIAVGEKRLAEVPLGDYPLEPVGPLYRQGAVKIQFAALLRDGLLRRHGTHRDFI